MMNLIIATFMSLTALANSISTIQGKLVSVSETTVSVQKHKTTYYIKKSGLPPKEVPSANSVGKDITLHIPLEAIEATKIEK